MTSILLPRMDVAGGLARAPSKSSGSGVVDPPVAELVGQRK